MNNTCEACEGHERIEIEPDSEYYHPCDTCQPELNKAFNEGVEYGKSLSKDLSIKNIAFEVALNNETQKAIKGIKEQISELLFLLRPQQEFMTVEASEDDLEERANQIKHDEMA